MSTDILTPEYFAGRKHWEKLKRLFAALIWL